DGAAASYADVVVAGSRLHRPGGLPSVGPDAIGAWLTQHAASLTATSTFAEAAASADFGYSYGKYEVKGGERPESGAYVRLWSRDGPAQWRLAADVTQPPRRPPA